MGSSMDRRPIAPPNDRRARDLAVMVGIGIILLFAVIGVVSAGIFVGGRVTNNSAAKPTPRASTGNPVAAQDIARARAQATQIVRAAQVSSKRVVSTRAAQARRQAAAIVAAARRQAASIAAAAPTPAPAPVTYPTSSTQSTGAYSASGSTTTGTDATGSTSSGTGSTASGTSPTATVNLGNLPASWLVVAYNATFGSGPGSAGSVTVTNRSSKTFSGTAQVVYSSGGSASAPFAGLAPGQTLVLPLNGPVYPGGGYSLRVVNPH